MILTNARLIFPDGIRDGLELVVEKGKIVAIREQTRSRGKEIVDLGENYLAPGFIDLHVHGALARDTMEDSAQAFRTICDFHASGGTTSLLLTTATAPLDKLGQVLNAVRDCIQRRALGGTAGRPTIQQIAGVHVEGPFISKARCGAQRAEFIQDPSPDGVRRLLEYADVIKRVTIAPELPGALEAIESFHAHRISVSGGHSDAWDEDAHAAFEHGMCSVTHTFNCMSSARRVRARHAQCHAYLQLHVVRAPSWSLSCWRFARVCIKRAANQLRTNCRRPSRFADVDENVVPRQRPGRNLPRYRCNCWGRTAG